ncbi:hypothetical protein HYDPIDRAFT_26760 [Hydnomerulius pinastri MD-312]|nr:hypothetical protein HYDPIDRAFT_26760 [Hydnomerulius pinastri MD-312]
MAAVVLSSASSPGALAARHHIQQQQQGMDGDDAIPPPPQPSGIVPYRLYSHPNSSRHSAKMRLIPLGGSASNYNYNRDSSRGQESVTSGTASSSNPRTTGVSSPVRSADSLASPSRNAQSENGSHGLRQPDPVQLGPVISKSEVDRILQIIATRIDPPEEAHASHPPPQYRE